MTGKDAYENRLRIAREKQETEKLVNELVRYHGRGYVNKKLRKMIEKTIIDYVCKECKNVFDAPTDIEKCPICSCKDIMEVNK